MKKNNNDLVKSWLEKARRDLQTAKNILNSNEPFTDIACFHAQQAGEKHIKAYLIWQKIEFPKIHSLEDLCFIAAKKDPSFLDIMEDAGLLTPYAVEIRYAEWGVPIFEDAEKAVEIAEVIRDFIFNKLPNEVLND